MDDPELQGDEKILIRTQGVHVKSISFEAILTNKRIILIDRLKNLLPPKEIPLGTIQSIEPGENAIRDLTITLGVVTKSGGARQMVLTFSREGGGNRIKERDAWVRQINAILTPSFEQVIRKVIPGIDKEQAGEDREAARVIRPQTPTERPPDFSPVIKKIVEKTPESLQRPEPVTESVLGTYCTRCGTKVPEGSGFCTRCGAQIMPSGGIPQSPASSLPLFTSSKELPPDRDKTFVDLPVERTPEPVPEETPAVANSLPNSIIPDAPARFSEKPVSPEQAVPHQTTANQSKKRFIPKLFSPKDLSPTPLVPSSMPTAIPPPPKKSANKKKILLAAGIIVIILIAVVAALVVLPRISSPGSHIPSGSPVATATTTIVPVTTLASGSSSGTPVVIATQTPAALPTSGVAISVSYLGGFNGTYIAGGDTTTITGSGSKVYPLENATGSVTAMFEKMDETTTHPLTVSIYENGKQLATGNTSAAYGRVTVTASV
jgi:hypothetical protein